MRDLHYHLQHPEYFVAILARVVTVYGAPEVKGRNATIYFENVGFIYLNPEL
jgi:hypothetical protein